jgi:peptidoglycan/xylan/chitin deacetylase (PgdA/CDA1 family)
MFIRPETFCRRMVALAASGCNVIPLDEAVDALAGRRPLPKGAVVITIDDGWASTFETMLPELARHGFPATLYCHTGHHIDGRPVIHVLARYARELSASGPLSPLAETAYQTALDLRASEAERLAAFSEFCAEAGIDSGVHSSSRNFAYMTETELRELHQAGVDVQLHTHTHSLGDFSGERINREIELNRTALCERLGVSPGHFRHFCYPSGEHNAAAVEHLRQLGLASATTCETGLARIGSDPLQLPRIMDGDHLHEVEFEAELSGFAELLRTARRFSAGLKAKISPPIGPVARNDRPSLSGET